MTERLAHVDGADVLESLPSLSLAELNSVAALRARVDRKYVVPADIAWSLIARAAESCHVLEIDGRRRFAYESLYFDTPQLDSYHSAQSHRRHRFKVRTRLYIDTGTCVLEVKVPDHRGGIVKTRSKYTPADRRSMTADGATFVDETLRRPGLAAQLQPVLTTKYDRITVVDTSGGSRTTIDFGTTILGSEAGHYRADPGWAIIESKSGHAATNEDRWLWSGGYRPVLISKFAVGMAAVFPELPSNRWHRVLNKLALTEVPVTP